MEGGSEWIPAFGCQEGNDVMILIDPGIYTSDFWFSSYDTELSLFEKTRFKLVQ